MLTSARRALRFVAGMTEAEFLDDEKTQDSVVRRLEVIGEAASNVTAETRMRLPGVPWEKVIAQRHIAIHHYRKLNYSRIWATTRDDLPRLVEELARFLQDLP
jgi:uncharacterized protein with HEPN domain